jgi:hypothetical protein
MWAGALSCNKKISRAEHSWTNPFNALQEAIHNSFIKFCIYCFSLGYEFLVHHALRVEKIINMFSMRDIWNFIFLGRGDVSPTHSQLCRFLSRSQVKHQVSSPVILVFRSSDFTRRVMTRTLSKINKLISTCERMLVDST